jgi:hypothetical protein
VMPGAANVSADEGITAVNLRTFHLTLYMRGEILGIKSNREISRK